MRNAACRSLRWHYPDQVDGSVLSRALRREGSTPWLELLTISGEGAVGKEFEPALEFAPAETVIVNLSGQAAASIASLRSQ